MIRIGAGIQGVNRQSALLLWCDFDVIIFMQYDIAEIRWLRAHGWQGEVWLRWYHPNSMSLPPERLGQEVYDWLLANNDVGISHIILWNELNLAGEHGGELFEGNLPWDCLDAYIAINAWCCEAMCQFRTLGRQYIVHWGALSPGHNPPGYEPEYEYNLLAASVRYADVVDIHVYGPTSGLWSGTGRAKAIIAKLNKLGIYTENIAITETNQTDYVGLLHWLKVNFPGLRACCWFLWNAEDPRHSEWDLINQDLIILQHFTRENRQEAIMNVFVAWCQALSPGEEPTRERFIAFLRDIGKPNPEDAEAYGFPVTSGDFIALAERVAKLEAAMLGIGDALQPFR